jgi:hypothetical protein
MTSDRPARGRLFQDEAWSFGDLYGSTLERLLVHVDEATGSPSVVFLRASGHFWQRFFLDAGLGFWGEYEDLEIDTELEESSLVDYGHKLELIGQRLGHVQCDPGPRIRVATSSGDFILETTDESILDAPSRVRFEPKSGAS